MKTLYLKFTSLLIAAHFLFSCSSPSVPTTPPTPPPAAKKVEVIPIDSNLTRISKLMAGMDTNFSYSHPDWNIDSLKIFARQTASKYQHMKESRLSRIGEWNKANYQSAQISDSAFVFYPFSGGDFIHVNWLLPNAKDYLMVARESVGTIPNLTSMNNTELMKYLNGVERVLRDIYTKSYFITKNMIVDIKNNNLVDGMLPIIVWAAAKTNHEIKSIEYFNIDSTGHSIGATAGSAAGVRLELKINNSIKHLTYLSTDISNDGFTKSPAVKTYLNNTVPNECNSFVKSASYLMHYGSFDEIRNIILEKSNCLVQDDTGIPFKYFDQSKWNIHLFGQYQKPVKDFSPNLFQTDMNTAYQDPNFYKGPIDFSLGYHWENDRQNQMFSYKKK